MRGCWQKSWIIRPFSGHIAPTWSSRNRDVASKANDESEKVLEVFESTWCWWRQVFADLVLSDHFAEAVAKIQLARKSEVNAYMRAENWSGGSERQQ